MSVPLLRIAGLVVGGLMIAISMTDAPAADSRIIQLDNDQSLSVESISYSRILPYAFYDQAMASLPALYPGIEILVQRRLGQLGSEPIRLYALIGYREKRSSDDITLQGVVTQEDQAWAFNLKTTRASLEQTLVLVVEFLSGPDF